MNTEPIEAAIGQLTAAISTTTFASEADRHATLETVARTAQFIRSKLANVTT